MMVLRYHLALVLLVNVFSLKSTSNRHSSLPRTITIVNQLSNSHITDAYRSHPPNSSTGDINKSNIHSTHTATAATDSTNVPFTLKSFNYCDTSTQDSYCPFPNKALYEGTEISFSHPSSHNILLQWKEQPKRIFFLAKFDTMMWKEIHETLFYLHGLGIEIVVEQTLYDFIRGNSICNLDHHPPEDMVISSNPNTLMNRSEVDDVNDDDRKSRCMDYPLIPLKIFQHGFKQVDLIITFGGDGLLLHCNTLFAGRAVPPVMCFDFGSLGFLSPFLYRSDLSPYLRSQMKVRSDHQYCTNRHLCCSMFYILRLLYCSIGAVA